MSFVGISLRDNDAPDRANTGPLAQVIRLHPFMRASLFSMLGGPPTTREVNRLAAAKLPRVPLPECHAAGVNGGPDART